MLRASKHDYPHVPQYSFFLINITGLLVCRRCDGEGVSLGVRMHKGRREGDKGMLEGEHGKVHGEMKEERKREGEKKK